MIIGYSKLGRSWNLDPKKASTVGGDIDVVRLLHRLAWDHPEDTFLLVGRNSGEDPRKLGYPGNVVNPWLEWNLPSASWDDIDGNGKPYVDAWMARARVLMKDVHLDEHIMWLGQHGTSNSCLPNIGHDWGDGEFTKPQASMLNYCGYLLQLCNMTGVQPVLVCPDPRNYIKGRELKHGPKGKVLAQYEQVRQLKCDQFDGWAGGKIPDFGYHHPGHREQSVWVINTTYEYAAIELTALDEPLRITRAVHPGSIPVGLISNENRKNVGRYARLPLLKEWFIRLFADTAPIYGKWSDASMAELGMTIQSVPNTSMYDVLRTFRSTITFPASGSGWATAKPWEAFACGTVMFFHPRYDDQGHILPLEGNIHWTDGSDVSQSVRRLSRFLRVRTVNEFEQKVEAIARDDQMWAEVSGSQRQYFEMAFKYWRGGARRVEEVVYDR